MSTIELTTSHINWFVDRQLDTWLIVPDLTAHDKIMNSGAHTKFWKFLEKQAAKSRCLFWCEFSFCC